MIIGRIGIELSETLLLFKGYLRPLQDTLYRLLACQAEYSVT